MMSRCSFRVYYGDTDAGGVMYHGAYVDFCARARNEWTREQGLHLDWQASLGVCFIVHDLAMTYHKPAVLDDLLTIETRVLEASRIQICFEQKIYREEALLCEAKVTVVSVDNRTFKIKRLPSKNFGGLSAYS
jgi:acyl-CoA thioester hydrolase